MAWKFKKSIKIIPGIRLNISKSGISTTIGVKGASINLGAKGVYLNTGIPGTGIYNRQKILGASNPANRSNIIPFHDINLPQPEVENIKHPDRYDNIFSLDAHEITSQDMQGIKDSILTAHQQRKELFTDRFMVIEQWKRYEKRLKISYWLLYGFLFKEKTSALKADIKEQKTVLEAIEYQLNHSVVELDFDFDTEMLLKFNEMQNAFVKLCATQKIWDITATHANDQFATRSAAAFTINRRLVNFKLGELAEIKSKIQAMVWQNANGADLYFYPNFMVVWHNKIHFAIVSYNEIDINCIITRFIEEETLTKDSQVVDQTWHKVNKNGQPDKRFRDNYQIPIVAYGDIELKTATGLNERYLFSSKVNAEIFNKAFLEYQIKLIQLSYHAKINS